MYWHKSPFDELSFDVISTKCRIRPSVTFYQLSIRQNGFRRIVMEAREVGKLSFFEYADGQKIYIYEKCLAPGGCLPLVRDNMHNFRNIQTSLKPLDLISKIVKKSCYWEIFQKLMANGQEIYVYAHRSRLTQGYTQGHVFQCIEDLRLAFTGPFDLWYNFISEHQELKVSNTASKI